MTPKALSTKGKKLINWGSSKLRDSVLQKTLVRKWKDKLHMRENTYKPHLVNRLIPKCRQKYQEYVKMFQNSIIRKPAIQLKNGQNI